MGQASIILVIALAITIAVISLNTEKKIDDSNESSIDYYSKNVAATICKSAGEMLLGELAVNSNFRVSISTTKDMLGGTVEYTVKDTSVGSESKIKIKIRSNYNNAIDENTIIATILRNGFIPPAILAAITTRNDVQTLGGIIVDGRDHDLSGNVLNGTGVFGIWTTHSFNQSGTSKIGGTSSIGTDYTPSNPGNSNVIKTYQTYSGGYPNTPDKVMGGTEYGFPEGTLKSLAQKGWEGSQYVTSPKHLKFPLSGVTYVEAQELKLNNISGQGILIVHNAKSDAIIKNVGGNFTGIIISDDIVNTLANFLGAVVSITPNPSAGACIGNANGSILYSREAILNAAKMTQKGSDSKRNHSVRIDSWTENRIN